MHARSATQVLDFNGFKTTHISTNGHIHKYGVITYIVGCRAACAYMERFQIGVVNLTDNELIAVCNLARKFLPHCL